MVISQRLAAEVVQDLRALHRAHKGLPPSLIELGKLLKEHVLTPEGMRATAPYEVESETSQEAAEPLTPKSRTEVMNRIFDFLLQRGADGATADECEVALNLYQPTCTARIKDLRDRGDIVFAGRRRKTRRNRLAEVYVVRDFL